MHKKDKTGIPYSVVIPSYCNAQDLLNCLSSIKAQDFDKPYEIVVADSSPEDPTDKIHELYPDVNVCHLKQRTLSGRARTKGAELAKGDIIFFTDTDCIVDKNWMNELLKGHDQGYKVVGGSVANGTPDNVVGTTEYLVEFNQVNPHAKAKEVRALPSCNLSVHKDIFNSVGYFPDFLKGEDTLFCENVILSGEKIYFNPKSMITHMNRTGFMHYVKNQVALGEGSFVARKRAKLHGHFLLDYPFLVPLTVVFRTFAIAKRFLQSNIRIFFRYLVYYPLILIGLAAHVWGFIRGPYRSGLSTEKQDTSGS